MRGIDITGEIFGRLTAISPTTQRSCGSIVWRCWCDCGTEIAVSGADLRSGHSKSCGCLNRELSAKRKHTHGESVGGKRSREYTAWVSFRSRCRNPNDQHFANYGGRGIDFCDRWESYENFLADMGRCPPGLSLDRINNDGNYEPGNCRWATLSEQNSNKRRRAAITADLR